VTVASQDDKRRSQRVTDDAARAQVALPQGIHSRTGPRRLLLATCGGPLDEGSGRYRDNVILTAPLR
jgi:hypothetical protein